MQNRKGFTLIEVLIVLAVIGLIVGMVFGMYQGVYYYGDIDYDDDDYYPRRVVYVPQPVGAQQLLPNQQPCNPHPDLCKSQKKVAAIIGMGRNISTVTCYFDDDPGEVECKTPYGEYECDIYTWFCKRD